MNIENDAAKWAFLRDAPTRDAQKDELKQLAFSFHKISARSPWRHWSFAQLALALVRDCIVYRLDSDRVGREQIDGYTDPEGNADASFTRGYDDCDGKARLFVAICLSGGLRAEMVPRWKGEKLAHVYARVWCAGPNETARWWWAETILRRARLGEDSESVPKEPDTGKWLF